MFSRDFAKIYHNMFKLLEIVGKYFTKLKFKTEYFDKSTFSKSLKIIRIAYILHVYSVERWYSSNKPEIIQVLLKHFWQTGEIISTCKFVFTSP